MTVAIEILSWLFLLLGSFFAVMGGIGIIRMPDFYSRMHGAGITDTMGAGMIILGLIFQSLQYESLFTSQPDITQRLLNFFQSNLISVKLLLILFFSMVVSPSSCHALARSAIVHGLKPVLDVEPKDGDGTKS